MATTNWRVTYRHDGTGKVIGAAMYRTRDEAEHVAEGYNRSNQDHTWNAIVADVDYVAV